MSTKTNFKRIALVAVAALGLGVLTSVAPANAGDSLSVAAGTTGGIDTQVAGNSGICGYFSETGVELSNADAETTVTDTSSLGTVVMTVGGELNIKVKGAVTVVSRISGSSAVFVDKDGTVDGVSLAGKLFDPDDIDDTVTIRGIAAGDSAVKTYTNISTTTALATVAITVVAACGNGSVSAADSAKEWNTASQAAVGDTSSTASVFSYTNGAVAYLTTFTKNAYGSYVTPGTWVATTNNNCSVGISSSAATSTTLTGISAAALTLTDGDGVWVAVSQGTANEDVAVTCTVTLTYGSTVVDSTAIKFTGDLASITVSGADVQYNIGSTLTNLYNAIAKDAAGNQIQVALTADAATLNQDVTGITAAYTSTTLPTLSATTADDAAGAGAAWTCRTGYSGSVDVRVKSLKSDGVTPVYSNVFKASCGGDKYTYTASLDKAVYAPGDLATLTITAKDASGKAPSKNAPISGAIGAGAAPALSGAGLTPIATPAVADAYNANADGTYTYKFTVGSASTFEGKANLAVSLSGYSGTTGGVSVPYEVKSSSTAVTNADVLKAIVSLIASINKQIAALQKALLKK